MEFLKKNSKSLIFVFILIVGIFLRTYNFHDWLDFRNDQVRDAVLIGQIVDGESPLPLLGPSMRKSGSSKDDLFHLGPAYYYFQIVSAKIFGNEPDKMAYPDVFFAILSIPLFYFFLKKYFSVNISLAIVGLYSASFFAILYSRFAWNPNSIPFFTILFLLSLYELMINREKTKWIWPVLIGVAVGIGIQLHMILFILFPATLFFVFLFLIRNNRKLWSRFLLVFFVIVILNIPQIISEIRNDYANSKALLFSIKNGGQDKKDNILQKIGNTINCEVEANAYILSAIGQDTCTFSYMRLLEGKKITPSLKKDYENTFWPYMTLSFLFSIFGYFSLFKLFVKERGDEKKHFLGLVILYAGLSFFVMIPVVASDLFEYRYFINIFFVPFLFLGFLVAFLVKKFPNKYFMVVFLIFIFLFAANFSITNLFRKELSAKNRSDDHRVILGEIEPMVEYLIKNSENQKDIYLTGDSVYVSNLSKSFAYLAEKENVSIISAVDSKKISQGDPVFYIWKSSKNGTVDEFGGRKVESYKNFGQIGIYKLQN